MRSPGKRTCTLWTAPLRRRASANRACRHSSRRSAMRSLRQPAHASGICLSESRNWFKDSHPAGFEEEPDTAFGFVDPILQQACGGDVVLFSAQLMSFAHTCEHRSVVFAQFA